MAQKQALLTLINMWVIGRIDSEPHQRFRCFYDHETLTILLGTVWFQEQI